ncbi:MAG: SDR family oxidoreductase [Candidatus Moranbacteria bacterium]|jgi:dTDP-4-dehydrorhamnose reductase|nr:SDR family oxidoreductase [Candidatus Moranbacteria bacterium]
MTEKKKVLILGSFGMLGQELVQAFSRDEQYEVTGWDQADVDVTDFVLLEKKLRSRQPALVVNAVAYNAVDRCETDDGAYQKALLLNRDVPGFLARLSQELGFVLVHYSTDYVFDGALEENKAKTGCCGGGCCGAGSGGQVGYNEEALPNPLNRYGESKLAGERAVRVSAQKYFVIRLSKLFGRPGKSPEAKQSFFAVMLEQAGSKADVQVVDDEKSCFTYAPDLAAATKALVESESASGTYHLVNEGAATWYEAAQELYVFAEREVSVIPVTSETFPRSAKRPSCSVLLNTKRPKLRHYTEALEEFIHEGV